MGGMGSGGHNKLSDAEKKRKGTFRKDQSASAHRAKQAQKVVSGPWLQKIPDPTLKLDDVARAKYFEYAQHLMDQGTLTKFTCETVQMAALRYSRLQSILDEDRVPPAYLINQIEKDLEKLTIAETAAPIVGGPKRSRFAGVGFSQDRSAQISVRRVAGRRDRG